MPDAPAPGHSHVVVKLFTVLYCSRASRVPAEVLVPSGLERSGANCPGRQETVSSHPCADIHTGPARAWIARSVRMDRDHEVRVVLPGKSQRTASEMVSRAFASVELESGRFLQRAAQLFGRLQGDHLFRHSGHANRTRITSAVAGVDDDKRTVGLVGTCDARRCLVRFPDVVPGDFGRRLA